MKVTLEIKESKFAYFMDMLKSLDFVKVLSKENESSVSEPQFGVAYKKTVRFSVASALRWFYPGFQPKKQSGGLN